MNSLGCQIVKPLKKIWDNLQLTQEGTGEVKRSKLNTLSQEYEMLRMISRKNILDMQKSFTVLTNHLISLRKVLTGDELSLKVPRPISRPRQPNVTAISDKKILSKMTLEKLFG